METVEIKTERRGRKRRRKDNPDDAEEQMGKKQVLGARSQAFVGRYIKKKFAGSRVYIGKIVSYDSGLYRVEYEDGDCEDLDSIEVRKFNIRDDCFDDELIKKRQKLDKFLSRKKIKVKDAADETTPVSIDDLKTSEAARQSGLSTSTPNENDGDGDDLSDSCEHSQDRDSGSNVEFPSIPPPDLPPSTGNIGVPEEYVSHLFSVYTFLRSFSIRLFLSPFTLDDLVGSLNCTFSSTLLDSIHVALMRAIRRNLETLSTDGSELASKCLRYINWSLLDTLTWPAFLVQYLMVMGSATGPEWEGFYIDALERDYHALPTGRKLMVLQVLCNDVLDSSELRSEIDTREESEVGLESDAVAATVNESVTKRVQRGRPRTSGGINGAVKSSLETAQPNSYSSTLSIPKATDVNAGDDVEDDGNGDECRLCGMDGTLLCCDGCPSAYHSRCIGINKMFLPEGPWFCQECTINKIYPIIVTETSLRGAKSFGIDQYGQLFVGTCDHLLVLNTLVNSGLCVRYYNQKDIPKALEALCLSIPYIDLYLEICRAIVQNWNLNQDLLAFMERIEMVKNSAGLNGNGQMSVPLPFDDESQRSCAVENENAANSLTTNSNLKHVHLVTPSMELVSSKTSSHNIIPAELAFPFDNAVLPKQSKVDNMSSSSLVQQAYPFGLSYQRVQEKSNSIEHTSGSRNTNENSRTYVNGATVNVHSQAHMLNGPFSGKNHKYLSDCIYMGLQFKCHAYINHYTHGDFAASAAANLAVVMSEENRTSGLQASDRKVVSASISLQVKAFSSASIRFFWPHSEKKLVDVPRERCGWCFACRAAVTSRRGCLLNAAASNAIKGATKILSGLRPVKSGEGSLPCIATYIMVIEESLFGLTVGPFQNANYRQQWRKELEQASTCKAIKSGLLELEENIRAVTLSVDWIKLVDILSVESSASHNVTHVSGSTQKRGPGRRGRKPAAASEVTDDDSNNKLNVFLWWRGGMLSKLIFQRGLLPSSIVRKASRLGGSRKIPGIHYTDDSEIPKRSRQLVWRAAVEMSKNTSQLALQVRYLDLHIKWGDLVRPDQNIQETKGAESEASAFRNAFVCAKKVLDDRIIYGVAFGNQKHLPSRVMKSIIEVEQRESKEEIYWFLETGIPLYLIKDYECKTGNACLPLTHKSVSVFSKLQKNQLKASRKNIFNYLTRRRDNLDTCYCASCQTDVLLGSAVTCRSCQGFCHERCTLSSTRTSLKGEVEHSVTCKKCYRPKDLPLKESNNDSPSSPLFLLRQDYHQKAESVAKSAKQKIHAPLPQPLAFVENTRSPVETKSANDESILSKSRRKICSWGLIWRKKNTDDSGTDFRLKNILLKGSSDTSWAGSIECHLCHSPYNPNLIYIRCDTCGNWYHGDAVELDESKIFELLGFKCCRCRRIRSPLCPYLDLKKRKELESKRTRTRVHKQGNPGGSDADVIITGASQLQKEATVGYSDSEPATPALQNNSIFSARQDDHILVSNTKFPQFSEEYEADASSVGFVNGPKKLQVRRQLRREGSQHIDDVSSTGNDDGSNFAVPNDETMNTNNGGSLACTDWEISEDGFQDELGLDYDGMNYEDMEFEPQTYFSFTELLDTEEEGGGQVAAEVANGDEEASGVEWRNTEDGGGGGGQDDQMMMMLECGVDEVQSNNNIGFPCKMCCQEDPVPDLRCGNCGLIIHNHCSPWVEESALDCNWRCGHCRDWR
ncbi:DDT domain-containing protein PTM-like [Impatiens glandulifera]|uniref:DDT domain-containing protein PTM-like n=1 Tax=Impatiens glandulifera TaxID=253017 RepID=UPI001FB077B7|nr:DDT domain-containing protein PTM-like [Impatiens glandulifera]